jgi:hypothetical protein
MRLQSLARHTTPMMVVGYLIQVESDAYSIADDRHAYERGWDYGCDYRVLYKFGESDSLNDMRQDPYMDEWGAFRGNFQRRVYAVPQDICTATAKPYLRGVKLKCGPIVTGYEWKRGCWNGDSPNRQIPGSIGIFDRAAEPIPGSA